VGAFPLTRINIAPTILPKKIEEVLEAYAHPSDPTCDRAVGKSIRSIDEEAANMAAVAIIRGAV